MSRLRLAVIASGLLINTLCAAAVTREDVVPVVEKAAASESAKFAADMGFPNRATEELQAADQIRSLGPDAIPYLLPLLKREDKGVRRAASIVLATMDGFHEEHLDALIEARLNGDPWIPPAIARVGTTRAIDFLVSQLKKGRRSNRDLIPAFIQLREKGVSCLVRVIEDDPNQEAVQLAVLTLGVMGKIAEPAVPAMQKLARKKPAAYEDVVALALLTVRGQERVARLLRQLELNSGSFSEIAGLKTDGKALGPALVPFLTDNDWELRIGAAEALGYIGYAKAGPNLIDLLGERDDWRQAYVAAEALGRLRARDAVTALTQLSKDHWYPPVREAAKKAIAVIAGKDTYKSEFDDYKHARVPDPLSSMAGEGRSVSRHYASEPDALDRALLTSLQHNAPMPPDIPRDVFPGVGIRVSDGYLVGRYYCELGGELAFFGSAGQYAVLLREHTVGIHKTAFGILAVTSPDGEFPSRGVLYRVSRGEDELWQAHRWKALLGYPLRSGVVANGDLCVECSGGTVEVSPDGEIKMASDR